MLVHIVAGPRVSLTGMCAGSVLHNLTCVIVRMPDVITWLIFDEASTDMNADLVPFNQTCLLRKKSYSTDEPTPDMPTNTVKLYLVKLLLHCQCNIYAC